MFHVLKLRPSIRWVMPEGTAKCPGGLCRRATRCDARRFYGRAAGATGGRATAGLMRLRREAAGFKLHPGTAQ
eukprot:15442574-Alexandrium_andersonii.AAC.1